MKQMILSALALSAIVAPAMAAEWSTDLPSALTKAAAEKKDVLVLFTGSDWCPPCKALKANILDKPEFEAYAKDKFVLVEIDLPRQKQLPEGLLVKNRELAKKYQVQGYPTMLVMNPEGTVTAGFIGGRPSLDAAKDALTPSPAVATALTAAASATGTAKAKALYDAYNAIPEDFRGSNVALMEQIKALDPEDTLGLKKAAEAEAAAKVEMQRIQQALLACGTDFAKARTLIDTELAKPNLAPAIQSMLLEAKVSVCMILAETEADIVEMGAIFEKLAELNPSSAGQIKAFAAQLTADPAAALARSKQMRESMQKK